MLYSKWRQSIRDCVNIIFRGMFPNRGNRVDLVELQSINLRDFHVVPQNQLIHHYNQCKNSQHTHTVS